MPDVPATATLESPAAEADEAQSAASEESASPSGPSEAELSASMNALLRGQLVSGDSTSKSDDTTADAEDAEEPDGASASSMGDVKPSDPPTTGRRGAAAEIARLKADNERLEAAINDLRPPVPDASEEARTKAIETENRYRHLLVKPDSDLDWTNEDWDFLASEKQRRALVPELRQHYETVLDADRRALAETNESERGQFWAHVRADMASARDVPGVDFEAVKAAPTFAERDRLMYAAGQAAHEPELKALREEVRTLKREMLGATRAPMNGGRSSPGRTYSENDFMNTIIRGGRT